MIGEYKGHSFPPNSKLALKVPQDVPEIDVEQLQNKQKKRNCGLNVEMFIINVQYVLYK